MLARRFRLRRRSAAGSGRKWRIDRGWAAEPQASRVNEYAYTFVLSSEGAEVQTTVEFVRGDEGSATAAWGAVWGYLDRDTPPRRLVVDDGQVTVIDE